MTSDNRDKFSYVAGQFNQLVKFYNVEALHADKINEFWRLIPAIKTAWSTIGTFFKLLIPEVIPADVDKVIYLDSDMLVNLDIQELWKINLDDKPLAAVLEMEANAFNYKTHDAAQKYLLTAGFVKYEEYFNAGLLLMNLKYLRQAEELIMSGVKWRGEHPQCNCFDQDIWNYLFSKNYFRLPEKFDRFICNERSQGRIEIQNAIYHCTNPTLGLNVNEPFNRLWLKYFMKTPWFDEETIGRLYAGVQKMHIELKQSLVNLSAMMSGKTRAFFTPPRDVDGLKKFFLIRDDEEIILAENQASLQKLLDAMNASRGKKVFFIMLPAFPFQALIQAGFVPNSDFVNGLEFLSEAQGLPLNSYPLIKAM
ncbi:MAG: hypothetical protein II857_09470 [Selenomonadaceae bacterium]|nr:hypothetical protein [Selenomonadaceae bacterium]